MTGTILWFDHRDGYGIIVDERGNELYASSDVYDLPELARAGVRVSYVRTERLGSCLCAFGVRIDLASAVARQEVVVAKLAAYDQSKLVPNALAIEQLALENMKQLLLRCV